MLVKNRVRLMAPFARNSTATESSTTKSFNEHPPENTTKLKLGNQPNRRLKYGPRLLLLVFIAVGFVYQNHVASPQQHLTGDVHNKKTVAYAITLMKCSKRDKKLLDATFLDAALVLRHSVHLQSSRNPSSGSSYDYKMYALVHPHAKPCSRILRDAGFTIVVVHPPLKASQLQDAYVRENIHTEECCGVNEFIQLHALLLPEPVVVHVNTDVTFLQPMDDLYDALLYDASSPNGQTARARIPLEKQWANITPSLPHDIDAFITRDWPQVLPGRKPGFQTSFFVARRSPTMYHEILQTIRTSNYTPGYSRDNGWGGRGYGAFPGAMTLSGVMAYYFDVVRPHTAVELNHCRYNWMGMQTKYVAEPNFKPRHPKVGQCRNDGDYCEDCRYTPANLIHNVHYTQCLRPWDCISFGVSGGQLDDDGRAIDLDVTDVDACLVMLRKWHDFRTDMEQKWYDVTHDELIQQGQSSDFKRELFQGHCRDDGAAGYNPIRATRKSLQQLSKLYN